jgi:hypothetical protein
MKESRCITTSHLQEVIDRRHQCARGLVLSGDLRYELGVRCMNRRGSTIRMVGQNVCCLVHPTVGALNVRPDILRRCQPMAQHAVELGKFAWEIHLCAASRATDTWIVDSRAYNPRRAAPNGGCPSSVSALRTAR